MEGRQIVLQVDYVNEELGEICCTLVAVSGDIKDGAIDIVPIKVEDGPAKPYQHVDPELRALIEAAMQFNAALGRK